MIEAGEGARFAAEAVYLRTADEVQRDELEGYVRAWLERVFRAPHRALATLAERREEAVAVDRGARGEGLHRRAA
jgi:hypothetical protein